MDQEYKRLWYCRYADDFLIGVISSKADAQGIMDRVKAFVQETLKLTIAEEKSGIRHAAENTRFLGFDLRVHSEPSCLRQIKRNGVYYTQRVISEQMQLHIPMTKLYGFAEKHGYGNLAQLKAVHRYGFDEISEAEVVLAYNAELRDWPTIIPARPLPKVKCINSFAWPPAVFSKQWPERGARQ